MRFPELTSVNRDTAWPLVRLSAPVNGGTVHVSYVVDKHMVAEDALAAWLSAQELKDTTALQPLKNELYHSLMPRVLQMIFTADKTSYAVREIQPGLEMPASLSRQLDDEVTKRTVY